MSGPLTQLDRKKSTSKNLARVTKLGRRTSGVVEMMYFELLRSNCSVVQSFFNSIIGREQN